jgi:hypothetical protein
MYFSSNRHTNKHTDTLNVKRYSHNGTMIINAEPIGSIYFQCNVMCTFMHKIVLTCDDIREWLVYTRDDKKIKYLNGSGMHRENKIKMNIDV